MKKQPAKNTTSKLTATSLKNTLWDTLLNIRDGNMQAGDGDAIACQAREILRTVKVQLQVAAQTNRGVSQEVVAFAES